MKTFGDYLEMAAPRSKDRARKYYHGTDREEAGTAILREGIRVPDLTTRKGKLKPREGKVYVTQNLRYAIMYALGGNMLGSNFWLNNMGNTTEFWKNQNGRYGYLFEISGKDFIDIEPDEDSVGEMFAAAAGSGIADFHDTYEIANLKWLVDLANYAVKVGAMTRLQLKRAKGYDDYGDLAVLGKKLIPLMSDVQKLELIDKGAHVAHAGNIKPVRAWRIDKVTAAELKKDGSNFFKIAKRIK